MKITNNAVTEAWVNGVPYVYSFAGIDSTKLYSGIGLWSFRYNTVSDAWDSVPPLPDTLGKIAASANRVKDLIYIIGGYHVFSNHSELSSDKVHIYDPASNSYLADGASIPVPIDDQVQAVWRDSLIYVITGWSQIRNVPNVQIYNPALNVWVVGTSIPNLDSYRSFGSSGIIVGDTIFYFGGASSNSTRNFPIQNGLRMGIIDPINPDQIVWSDTILDSNLVGYRMACTQLNGNIHWIGGANRTYNFDGIAYSNGTGVAPNNRNLYLNPKTLRWDTDSAIGLDFPMDIRGIAEVSSSTRYLAGGMELNQQVTNRTLKLEFLKNSFAIEQQEVANFYISPNPVFEVVRIFFEDQNKIMDLVLFDIKGNRIKIFKKTRNGEKISLDFLEPGSYVLKDEHSNGSVILIKN